MSNLTRRRQQATAIRAFLHDQPNPAHATDADTWRLALAAGFSYDKLRRYIYDHTNPGATRHQQLQHLADAVVLTQDQAARLRKSMDARRINSPPRTAWPVDKELADVTLPDNLRK